VTDEPDEELELTSALVPLFVIANGGSLPPEHAYERTALVSASEGAAASVRTLSPEARQVLELVMDGFLSVAEVAAHTHLPLGVVRILLAQMEDSGLIIARKPVPRAERVDRDVLNAVLDGLRARFGA
jgi:DNA-directed RNA polymerase specialized sigma24 family protein